MPSLCILFKSVVRLRSSRSEAPSLPEIFPLASFKALMIAFRSLSRKVKRGATRTLEGANSARGAFNLYPDERITARSMKFGSEREFVKPLN